MSLSTEYFLGGEKVKMFQLFLLTIALHWNAIQMKIFKVITRVEIKTVRMTLEKKHFNYSKPKHFLAND